MLKKHLLQKPPVYEIIILLAVGEPGVMNLIPVVLQSPAVALDVEAYDGVDSLAFKELSY